MNEKQKESLFNFIKAKLERRVLQKNPKRTRDMNYEEFLSHTRKITSRAGK